MNDNDADWLYDTWEMLTVPCILIMRTINDADGMMNGTVADCTLSPGWNPFDVDKVMNHVNHCHISSHYRSFVRFWSWSLWTGKVLSDYVITATDVSHRKILMIISKQQM